LIGATGCAQVFGIENTTGKDADPARVSVQMQKVQIGATVKTAPLDLSGQTATFLEEDGAGGYTRTPGDYQPVDTFSAAIPVGTPAVLFTLPDQPTPFPRLWEMPARNRIGAFGVFEHDNPQEPSAASALTVQMSLPSAFVSSERFRIEAIGAWTGHAFVTGTETAPPDVGYTSFTTTLQYSTFGKLTNMPVRRITSDDVVVVERYVGTLLTAVYQAPAFDQTDGPTPDSINAMMSALTPNLPFNATIKGATLANRLTAVNPRGATQAINWSIVASPGYSIGSNAGVLLNAGGVADLTMDTTIATMYSNPFDTLTWHPVVTMSAFQNRTYMFMAMPLVLGAGMQTVAEPTSSSISFDMPAGLPITISANQMPLTSDGMSIALDLTKAVEFTAQLDRPTNTFYGLTVVEVALNSMMTGIDRIVVVDAITTGEAKFKLPPDLFKVDHYYYVTFRSSQGGYTNAATGDLQNFTLPYSNSAADSAVFKVIAP